MGWSRGPLAGAAAARGGGAGPGRGSDSFPVFCTPDESSEEEDEDDELEEDEAAGGCRLGARERALSPGLEESGLGLLARFAASALPSPTVGPSLSVVQLEAKQKARKKEERQSLMGESRRWVPLPRLQEGLKRRTGTLPAGPGQAWADGPGDGGPPARRSLGRGLQSCAMTFIGDALSKQDLGTQRQLWGLQRPQICTLGAVGAHRKPLAQPRGKGDHCRLATPRLSQERKMGAG